MTAAVAITTSNVQAHTGPDSVRLWLRLEGVAVFVAAAVVYERLGGDWLWFIPLLLLPDLSAIGYLAGPVIGSQLYNLFHNWAVGLLVLGAGLALPNEVIAFAGAILLAHTGMDRVAGYGLKHPSGFKDTHLQRA